jgi:hypothetical protein
VNGAFCNPICHLHQPPHPPPGLHEAHCGEASHEIVDSSFCLLSTARRILYSLSGPADGWVRNRLLLPQRHVAARDHLLCAKWPRGSPVRTKGIAISRGANVQDRKHANALHQSLVLRCSSSCPLSRGHRNKAINCMQINQDIR